MKIVHVSCYDVDGGAARAAWRVHQSLRLSDAESSMFVAFRGSRDPDVRQYLPRASFVPRLQRIVRRGIIRRSFTSAAGNRPSGFDDFRDDRTVFGPEVGVSAPDADIYNLHQITEFVDCASLLRLCSRAPVVWTLHEMTAFTGGCHYAYDCDGFTRRCGSCPQLGSKNSQDLSQAVWQRRQRAYSRIPAARLHIVGPSRWIAAEACRSTLFKRFPVSVIPYGIDTDVFRPMAEARRMLDVFGVPSSARIILFVADWTGTKRKGFDLLGSALRAMSATANTILVSVGRGDAPKLDFGFRHVHLGSFSEDRMIAAVYSMADVFVIPSLQDNLPNTVLEAMACGTAVIGFRVGGIPDMVRDGENGLLVQIGDVAGLARAMEALLADDMRRATMGAAARRIAEREYTLKLQAECYSQLYRSIIGEGLLAAESNASAGLKAIPK